MTTTLDALRLPNREALAFFLGKTNTDTQHWTDVWQAAHSRSFMVAGAAGDDLLNDFRGAIRQAIEEGTTLADFRKQFDGIVSTHQWSHNGSAAWRSRVIYETNLSTAFSAGRYAQQTEPDTLAVYPFWQYVHSGAAHPRLPHKAWNGKVLRADDGFWKTHYPPNGWGCGCYVRPLSARGLARMGKTGPDAAPEVTFRDWRNPHTGQVMQVPNGVDPGFGYNPGEAWRGTMTFPPDAVTRVPPAPPPPVQARPGPQRPATNPPDAGPVMVTPAVPIPELRLPPAPLGGRPVSAEVFRAWELRARTDRIAPPPVVVGRLGAQLRAAIQREVGAEASPASRVIVATANKLARVTGKAARVARPIGLAPEDIARMPEILANPLAVLRQLDNGNLVYVFRPSDPTETRLGKVIVALDRVIGMPGEGGSRERNIAAQVISGGLSAAAQLRDASMFKLLAGKV